MTPKRRGADDVSVWNLALVAPVIDRRRYVQDRRGCVGFKGLPDPSPVRLVLFRYWSI
jgi:hypothetical protein